MRLGNSAIKRQWLQSWIGGADHDILVSRIEQGVADGLQLQPQAIAGFGFDKMIRHGTHTKTLMTVHVAQMNAETWDGLSAELQQVIKDASAEALKIANEADRADASKFLDQLSGTIEFYTPTDAEFEQWRSAALTVWDQFRDKIDADILARVVEVQE